MDNIIAKINIAFVIKIGIELILFLAFLKFSKKLVGLLFSKVVSKISDSEIKRQYSTIQLLCTSIINIVVVLFFTTNLLGAFGIDMKPILATAGVLGIAIGFGAQRFVEDIISGLMILLSGQIRVGDYITIDNSCGTVEKVNLMMIQVRAYNGDVHYVRNGLVQKVINHTREFSNPIVDIPVSYNSDVCYIIDVLRELGKEIREDKNYSKYILDEPEIVAIDAFLDSSILIRVRFKTAALQQWMVHRRYRMLVKQKFDELGIEMPFNQIDVHFKR